METTERQTPAWARKVQTRRGALRLPVGPFDRLDAPWKAREAAQAGVVAAGFMAALNVASALIHQSGRGPDRWIMARELGLSLPSLNLIAAGVLTLLAVHLNRTRSPITAWIVLAWAVADLIQLSFVLYGNTGFRFVTPLLLFAALTGVRGAMRLSTFGRMPDPAAAP